MHTSVADSVALPVPAPPVPTGFEEVCITHELRERNRRAPDLAAEVAAMQQLAGMLYAGTQVLLNQLLELALQLCHAESAGISLREGERFRWIATAGEYSGFIGGGTPFEESPCGRTVISQRPQLFRLPERHYTYFYEAKAAPMEEALLIPWTASGQQEGTLWVISHSTDRHFDAEDVRILTGLSRFVTAALEANTLNANLVARESEASSLAMARELAHHLNNPLQSAILALDLLCMTGYDANTSTEMLPIAREQVGRVAHIVQEILKLKKVPVSHGASLG